MEVVLKQFSVLNVVMITGSILLVRLENGHMIIYKVMHLDY